MSLNDNIKNAFEVVRRTYESTEKLIAFLDANSYDNGYDEYNNSILKNSSPSNHRGWLYEDVVKLYESLQDKDVLPNNCKDGPIYAVVFSFSHEPKVVLGRFEFKKESWASPSIGVGSVNYFSFPVDRERGNEFKHVRKGEYWQSTPEDDVSEKYWGLKDVFYREINLTEISQANALSSIFGEFDKLRKKYLEIKKHWI